MKIIPVGKKIQIEIEQPKAGALVLDSKKSAVEFGTILAIGKDNVGNGSAHYVNGSLHRTEKFGVGDKILLKAWALDVITHNDQTYYFIDGDSEGICAVAREDE